MYYIHYQLYTMAKGCDHEIMSTLNFIQSMLAWDYEIESWVVIYLHV